MVREGRVLPIKMDWRKCQPPRRAVLAQDLAIGDCEFIEKGRTLELGTVCALLGELQERIEVPEDTMLVEPTVAVTWARDGLEGDVNPRAEERAFVERVKAARHLYIVLHSENPPHYTLVEVHKHDDSDEPDTLWSPCLPPLPLYRKF